jgi:hypothetical protein
MLVFVQELWKARECLSLKAIVDAAQTGWNRWCRHVITSLGADRAAVIRTWALLEFADAYNGERFVRADGLPVVRFSNSVHIEEVRKFAEAGGINVWMIPDGTMDVEESIGCMRWLYSVLVILALQSESADQVKMFATVAHSGQTVKGHLLERLIACELTMLGTLFYRCLANHLIKLGVFQYDPLVFARPFVYEERIAQLAWDPHLVYCMRDYSKHSDRFVDVGCPLLQRNADGQPKVICELFQLSSVMTKTRTGRNAGHSLIARWNFRMMCLLRIALRVQSHQPRQAKSKRNSAYKCSRKVAEGLKSNVKLLVLDGPTLLKKWFQLPLVQIMTDLQLPDDLACITEGVAAKVYVSNSPYK